MRINEDIPRDGSLRPTIQMLGWLTLAYFFGFIAYEGRNQGLWFWYVSLRKPEWALPTWAFTPAWTLLYGALGTALWHIVRAPKSSSRNVLLVQLLCQLILSAASAWTFFSGHFMGASIALDLAQGVILVFAAILSRRTAIRATPLLVLPLTFLAYFIAVEFAILRTPQ